MKYIIIITINLETYTSLNSRKELKRCNSSHLKRLMNMAIGTKDCINQGFIRESHYDPTLVSFYILPPQ